MHPRARAERSAKAQIRLATAAEELAQRFKIDPELVQRLNPVARDPEVKAMLQLESMADILDAVLQATKIKKKKTNSDDPEGIAYVGEPGPEIFIPDPPGTIVPGPDGTDQAASEKTRE